MFERCLYFNVNALTRVINKRWVEAFKPFDLSPSHGYLVRLVLEQPGISPRDIALELKLEKSTVTRFLDVLEQKQFVVRRTSSKTDAREIEIVPTSKAKKIAESLQQTGDQLYGEMLTEIGATRLKSLVKELRAMEEKLSSQ